MADQLVSGIIVSLFCNISDRTTRQVGTATTVPTASGLGTVVKALTERVVKDTARNTAAETLQKAARKLLETNTRHVGRENFASEAGLAAIRDGVRELQVKIDGHNGCGHTHFVRGDGQNGALEVAVLRVVPDCADTNRLVRSVFRDVGERLGNIRLLVRNGDFEDALKAISAARGVGDVMPQIVGNMIEDALDCAREACREASQQIRDGVREAIRLRTTYTANPVAIGATLDLEGMIAAEGYCVTQTEEQVAQNAAAFSAAANA